MNSCSVGTKRKYNLVKFSKRLKSKFLWIGYFSLKIRSEFSSRKYSPVICSICLLIICSVLSKNLNPEFRKHILKVWAENFAVNLPINYWMKNVKRISSCGINFIWKNNPKITKSIVLELRHSWLKTQSAWFIIIHIELWHPNQHNFQLLLWNLLARLAPAKAWAAAEQMDRKHDLMYHAHRIEQQQFHHESPNSTQHHQSDN